jgi:hypothetical protein
MYSTSWCRCLKNKMQQLYYAYYVYSVSVILLFFKRKLFNPTFSVVVPLYRTRCVVILFQRMHVAYLYPLSLMTSVWACTDVSL